MLLIPYLPPRVAEPVVPRVAMSRAFDALAKYDPLLNRKFRVTTKWHQGSCNLLLAEVDGRMKFKVVFRTAKDPAKWSIAHVYGQGGPSKPSTCTLVFARTFLTFRDDVETYRDFTLFGRVDEEHGGYGFSIEKTEKSGQYRWLYVAAEEDGKVVFSDWNRY